MKKNIITLLSCLLLSSCSFNTSESSGISYSVVRHQPTGFFADGEYISPLNTSVTLTMYNQEQLDEVIPLFDSEITRLHKLVDRYHSYSGMVNLKTVNDSYGTGESVTVNDELFELIKMGVELTKLSEGAFNLAMGTLIDVYADENKFDNPNTVNTMPEISKINDALTTIPNYEKIDEILVLDETNKTVTFNSLEGAKNNVVISLGAISKGYVVQKLTDTVFANKNYPAIINAGSSTIALVNNNPIRGYWSLALTAPNIYDYTDEYLAALSLNGTYNVSTSADNQQNFLCLNEQTNKYEVKHHILDSSTGTSNSYHRSVSLVSSNIDSTILDASSTAIYNMATYDQIDNYLAKIEAKYNGTISYFIADAYQDSLDEYVATQSTNASNLVKAVGSMVKNTTIR